MLSVQFGMLASFLGCCWKITAPKGWHSPLLTEKQLPFSDFPAPPRSGGDWMEHASPGGSVKYAAWDPLGGAAWDFRYLHLQVFFWWEHHGKAPTMP